MDPSSSNIDGLMASIRRKIEAFGFEVSGESGGTLADSIATVIAEDIASSAAEIQANPTGGEFPENEDDYAAWKAEKYGVGGRAFGIRTGQSFSVESLRGEIEASRDDMSMTYGTGRPPDSSANSGYIADSDREVTDVEKMGWMIEKNPGEVHPYEIGPYAAAEIRDVLADGLKRHLEE